MSDFEIGLNLIETIKNDNIPQSCHVVVSGFHMKTLALSPNFATGSQSCSKLTSKIITAND